MLAVINEDLIITNTHRFVLVVRKSKKQPTEERSMTYMYKSYFLPKCSVYTVYHTYCLGKGKWNFYVQSCCFNGVKHAERECSRPSFFCLLRTGLWLFSIQEHSNTFWPVLTQVCFGLQRRLNWPCLSAEPPSYTADTTSFPKGESTPPSSTMSRFPTSGATTQKHNQLKDQL